MLQVPLYEVILCYFIPRNIMLVLPNRWYPKENYLKIISYKYILTFILRFITLKSYVFLIKTNILLTIF